MGIGIALIVYALVGFFLLPAIIKWQLLKRLPAITRRTVAVQQVKLNPFALSLIIRGFTLKETNGDVFYSFDELYANLQLISVFKRAFVFKEIRLKKTVWERHLSARWKVQLLQSVESIAARNQDEARVATVAALRDRATEHRGRRAFL